MVLLQTKIIWFTPGKSMEDKNRLNILIEAGAWHVSEYSFTCMQTYMQRMHSRDIGIVLKKTEGFLRRFVAASSVVSIKGEVEERARTPCTCIGREARIKVTPTLADRVFI